MKKTIRSCTVLLILLTLLSVLTLSVLARPAEPEPAMRSLTAADELCLRQDVFAPVDAVIASAARQAGGEARLTAHDYCALLPQVRAAVEASGSYAAGSMRQNGSLLIWRTRDGVACCFDPRMEARLHGTSLQAAGTAQPDALPALPEGGNPSSVRIGLVEPLFDSAKDAYIDPLFAQYGPDYTEMLHQLSAATGGAELRLDANAATADSVAQMLESCGVVLFDSHGVTDYYDGEDDETSFANCSYLVLSTPVGLTDADFAEGIGQFGRYPYAMTGRGYTYVSGYSLANHMKGSAPHSLLYMANCSGMATEGLFAPLRAKGVETVWGYSQPVWGEGDDLYMKAVLGGVCEGLRFAEAVAAAKETYGSWDPHYQDENYTEEQCVAERVAFPITVSSEDPYPGRGAVNAVQTVRSAWSLFGTEYVVQALSADESLGTVSARGTVLTAAPAAGYQASGARVIAGSASVRQSGNLFVVTPNSDCTVEVRFAPKRSVRVTCDANGETLCVLDALEGDAVTLPQTAPTPEGWDFIGWTQAAVPITVDKPALLAPGGTYEAAGSRTLCALYTRVIAGGEPSYRLLTEAPEDWTGDYVLTSRQQTGGDYVLCGIEQNGAAYYDREDGSPYLFDTGIDVDGVCGDVLRYVDERYVFTVAERGSGYTIRNKAYGTYLSDAWDELIAKSTVSDRFSLWTLSFRGTTPAVKSTFNTRYTYLCCDRSYGFFLYSSTLDTLRLWKQEPGTERLYASIPAQHEHVPAEPVEEDRVEPGCTEPGGFELVTRCLVCGEIMQTVHTELPALGHAWSDWTQTQTPTCTEPGKEARVCARCGEAETHTLDPLGHDWQDVVTEPTCTEGGFTTHSCSRCAESYADGALPALGHDWQSVVTEPTCTTIGLTTYTCSRCGSAYNDDPVPAFGHAFGSWTQTRAPTCTEPGEEARVCARCEEAQTRVIDAPGHAPGEPVIENEKAPSCTEPGSYDVVIYCTVCGAELSRETKEIEAPGHTPGEPVIERYHAGTCTLPGGFDTVIYCTVCHKRLTVAQMEIVPPGHDWGAWTQTQAPGCEQKGEETRVCARCGETEARPLDALGHRSGEPVTENETAPTCTEPGSYDEVTYCAVCGAELTRESRPLDAPGHRSGEPVTENEKAPTCTEPGSFDEFIYCTVCGAELGCEQSALPALGHDWGAWTQTQAPSCAEPGVETRVCTRCGKTETARISAAGHSFENGLCTLCGVKDPSFVPHVTFTDVSAKAFYYDAVVWAVANDVTTGTSAASFSPNSPCTRAQVVTFLWRAAGKPEPAGNDPHASPSGGGGAQSRKGTAPNDPFDDVSPVKFYYSAVLWAVEQGITNGVTETSFAPNAPCTRGQVVTFLWRAAGSPSAESDPQASPGGGGAERSEAEGVASPGGGGGAQRRKGATPNNPFTDVSKNSYCYSAVLWAVGQGIAKGTSSDRFSPNKTCTRGEVVTFLYRAQ